MKIQLLCDNPKSWMISYAIDIVKLLAENGHNAILINSAKEVSEGDILILLSCEQVFRKLQLNTHNLVVHASALPKGRGWSPLTWQVLEGERKIPVTLFEAVEEIDAGPIYGQVNMELDGTELIDELREKLALAIRELIFQFVKTFPEVHPIQQSGQPTFYPRRNLQNSRLDVDKTISEQFNFLRICDNERYPVYFERNGVKYILKIYKAES